MNRHTDTTTLTLTCAPRVNVKYSYNSYILYIVFQTFILYIIFVVECSIYGSRVTAN